MKRITIILICSILILTGFFPQIDSDEPDRGTTLYVGGTGAGNYSTIQSAIDAASSGDTVFVFNGTYYEHVTINKQINIRGENKYTTVIDGSDSGNVVYISGNSVEISGFTIQHGGNGVYISNSNNNCITDNYVSNTDVGIYLQSSVNNTISNNNASSNVYHGINLYTYCYNNTIIGNNASNNDYGIYLHSSCNNNTIIGNKASNNDYGIFLNSNCIYNTISSNNANSNINSAICLYYSDDNNISNNNLSDNNNGIFPFHSSNNTISSNNANSNTYYGIFLESSINNTVTGNNASNNNYGIYLNSYCTNNTIKSNNITSNNYYGIFLDNSSNNNLTSNNVHSNFLYGIFLKFSSNNNVTFNNVSNSIEGIYVYSSNFNIFKSNNANFNTNDGIYLYYSSFNKVIWNNANSNNYYGIYVENSSYNTLIGNNASNNNYGIHIYRYSDNNTITRNNASNNEYGIHIYHYSDYNIIFNNYFTNTLNTQDYCNNIWNISKTLGTNIIGGPYLGGNYFSDYYGSDTDNDGLGDTNVPYGPGDYLPLVYPNQPPIADFNYSPITPIVDETIFFTDASIDLDGTIVNYTWYFGDSISYEMNPTHQYDDDGIYPVMLEITDNHGGVDTVAKMVPVDFQMMPISTVETGWNFISAPYNKTQDTHEFIIKYDGYYYNWTHATTTLNPTHNPLVNQYLFGWNRSLQTYTFERNLEPGYGYWMYAYQPCELWNQYDTIPPDDYLTNVQLGWNTISIPDTQSVDKTDLLVDNIPWNTAVSNGWISDYVFGWNEVGQSYMFSSTFESGEAYWMYAYQECVLKK